MNKEIIKNKLFSSKNTVLMEKDQTVSKQDLINKDQKSSQISKISELLKEMTTNSHFQKITSSWQFWVTLLALTFGGVGFAATSLLLRLPTSPNCSKIYLPFASATNRIYCAQLQAEKKNLDGLLNAIALLDALPKDHPLRPELDRHLTEWGNEILALGEEQFQAGKLDEAINIATKIPSNLKTHEIVDQEIERWRSIWAKGEEIQIQLEKQLRLGNWNQAFLVAINLLNIPNDYWQTTKYQETINTINLAREESKKLDGAYAALRRQGIDSLLEAIKIANQVDRSSYAYEQAKKIIDDAKNEILEYAQSLIDDQKWKRLSELAAKIPDNLDLKSQAKDWNWLASAGSSADLQTVEGYELAMSEVSNILTDSPLYEESQKLIQTWAQAKEDLTYLADARTLAQPGDANSLNQAIAKAKLIDTSNPLYREAQKEIKDWQETIEINEDQPYLTRAKELAVANNITGWQEAINQANLIAPDRALYSEAQGLIGEWRRNIQQQEDQPLFDQATSLANNGNYQGAIDAASQIRSGRALYGEAQRYIRRWKREIKAQNDLNQAYQIAQSNNPESLLKAIKIARNIPSSASVKSDSRTSINRWSEQLLAIARSTANYSLKTSIKQAISIAEMIPSGTSAYESAQQQISSWQNLIKPPLVIPPATTIQETNFPSQFE